LEPDLASQVREILPDFLSQKELEGIYNFSADLRYGSHTKSRKNWGITMQRVRQQLCSVMR